MILAAVRRYPQCCREEEHKNPGIPTLMDIGGIPDEQDNGWEQVLSMLFYGYIPEDHVLHIVHDYVKKNEYHRKSSLYVRKYESLEVDKIIAVASATEEVPENLLTMVRNAANPQQGSGNRSISIFGVMTKKDLIDSETKETFQRKKKRFKDIPGLSGAEKRYLFCSTYCTDVDPDITSSRNLQIDVPILELMTQICSPYIGVLAPRKTGLQDVQDVPDVQDGHDVQDLQDGQDVEDLQDGQDVQDGEDGQDGQNGQDGQDGQDEKSNPLWVYIPVLVLVSLFVCGMTNISLDFVNVLVVFLCLLICLQYSVICRYLACMVAGYVLFGCIVGLFKMLKCFDSCHCIDHCTDVFSIPM